MAKAPSKKTPAADQGPAAGAATAAAPPVAGAAQHSLAGDAPATDGGAAARESAVSPPEVGDGHEAATREDPFERAVAALRERSDLFMTPAETIPPDLMVREVFHVSGLNDEEWDGLAEDVRDQMVSLLVAAMQATLSAVAEVRALAAKATAGDEAVTAKSRDGKPFRRGGMLWTDKFQTAYVTADQAEAIRSDPGILVKADD